MFLFLALLLLLTAPVEGATLAVINANDSGAGSLRQAIIDANAASGADLINFNIPGAGVRTINLMSPLPPITEALTIDGYSQPGSSVNTLAIGDNAVLLIELNGTNAGGGGFNMKAPTILRGLVVNRFVDPGVNILQSAPGTVITGCFFGTDPNGMTPRPNLSGNILAASSNNVIGGVTPALRNIIASDSTTNSGNGIELDGDPAHPSVTTGNVIQGNYIGVNAAGTAALGNGNALEISFQTNLTIGGSSAGARNVISGNNSAGIDLIGVTNSSIQGNYIGLDANGQAKIKNAGGIFVSGGSVITIGGPNAGQGNVISGNQSNGIDISGSAHDNLIQGNLVGTDPTGTIALGNGNFGLNVGGTFNQVGGAGSSVPRNVIAGNGSLGIKLSGDHNTLLGNFIGTDLTGTKALPNNGPGIYMLGAGANTIGDTSTGGFNLVSGNLLQGIYIQNSSGETVKGNRIGTDIAGGPLGNSAEGILIESSNDCFIGDLSSGGNTIAFNRMGIKVTVNSQRNMIVNNSIFANDGGAGQTWLGIDLNSDGVTPNDLGDGDNGANSLLNFPVITSALTSGATTSVTGTLNSAPNAQFSVSLFSNSACDPSGFGEGENVLGVVTVTTNAAGDAVFSTSVNAQAGQFITATATDVIGNTSEFSQCLQVISPGGAGALQFSAASYSVTENAGTATITVTRTSGSSGPASIQYATSNGTAKAGSDYTSASGTLNWASGDMASKTFVVPINNDQLNEANETINLTLTNPSAGAILGGPSAAVLTIMDDDAIPGLSISDVSQAEGNNGSTSLNFTVTLSAASGQIVTVDYTTADSTAQAGVDYQSTNGTLVFNSGQTSKQISVLVNGDTQVEPNETFFVNLSNPASATIAKAQGVGTIINDDNLTPATVVFNQATYSVQEDLGVLTVTITRGGDTTGSTSVDYTTLDGTATQKADFEYAAGTVTFAPGDTSKTLPILINEDMYLEGNETFTLTLSNPAGGVLGSQSSTTITIQDDSPETVTNPIDDNQNFVYMHYHDFLNREPDSAGLAFWTNDLAACGNDQACLIARRSDVSAAFFLSIEFRETGYLVYRMYKTSYGNLPNMPVPVRFAEFMPDREEIGRGVVVNQAGWEQVLESNKQAFAAHFVQRARFVSAFPTSLTPAQYVDALFANGMVLPSATDRQSAIDEFGGALTSVDLAARARALRRVAENLPLAQQEFNSAFVLMQYFGYLRRDPNTSPEPTLDYQGYNFWLNKLNQFNGNYNNAEMVKAFLNSAEYRQRFGQ